MAHRAREMIIICFFDLLASIGQIRTFIFRSILLFIKMLCKSFVRFFDLNDTQMHMCVGACISVHVRKI